MRHNIRKEAHYSCVNCGASVPSLYKKYNSDVLKLINCDSCQNVADKYVEYDAVIILIDLILFKREPYRHILYNTEFKKHWKLWVLTFILKTYVVWMWSKSVSHLVDEYAFYASAVITVAGAAFFLATILFGIKALEILNGFPKKPADKFLIWKALALAEFGQFLMLPSIVWTDLNKMTHNIVVSVYIAISRMQALSVVTSYSRVYLFMLLVLGMFLEKSGIQVAWMVCYFM